MSSKTAQISSSLYDAPPPDTDHMSPRSKCAIVAGVIGVVVGAIIFALGAACFFGGAESGGYIGSMAGGGVLVCFSLGATLWIAIGNIKNPPQQIIKKKTSQEPKIKEIKEEIVKPIPKKEKSPPVEKSSIVEQKAPPQKIAPASSEEVKAHNERREQFRKAAKERMERKPTTSFDWPQECNDETNVKEVMQFFKKKIPSGASIKQFAGGMHTGISSDTLPGVIFKQQNWEHRTTDGMRKYVEIAQKARKICEEKDLYLLYVPQCKIVDFDPDTAMQEKLDLWEGESNAHKNNFQWAVHDPELQAYGKEVSRQLGVLISLLGFCDVKPDNMPFMKDGRIALFDLDTMGAVRGLTESLARNRNKGLFTMIPSEWFEEFTEIAGKHLNNADIEKLKGELPDLTARDQNRKSRREKIAQFYKDNQVTIPTQTLVFNAEAFKQYDTNVVIFVQKMIERMNREIASLPHLSMVAGRKITIKNNTQDEFVKEFSKLGVWYREYREVEQKGLQALQDQGYIFSYKVNTTYNYFIVTY
jgi:hypothetical protein